MTKRYVFPLFFAFVLSLVISCSKGAEEPKHADSGTAPLFTVEAIDGKKVDLAAYRGKVVILDFFATWCEPCRLMAPELQKVYERYKDRGVVVIALAADEGPDAVTNVRAFASEYRLSYVAALDSGQVMKRYGAFSLPTTVVIDRETKIRSTHMGITANYAARLASEIEPLLK